MADSEASEAGRALVAIRWAKTTAAERSAYGKMMVDERERKKKAKLHTKPRRTRRGKAVK